MNEMLKKKLNKSLKRQLKSANPLVLLEILFWVWVLRLSSFLSSNETTVLPTWTPCPIRDI